MVSFYIKYGIRRVSGPKECRQALIYKVNVWKRALAKENVSNEQHNVSNKKVGYKLTKKSGRVVLHYVEG